MIYILIICLIIIGFLGFKLLQKQKIDKSILKNYEEQISETTQRWKKVSQDVQNLHEQARKAEVELANIKEQTKYEQYKLEDCKEELQTALDTYQDVVNNRMKELDQIMDEQLKRRTESLEETMQEKKAHYELMYQEAQAECEKQIALAQENTAKEYQECTNAIASFRAAKAELKQKYEGILNTLMTYEKEQQEKLFYTIQLPEEYQEDIEFLLTTVAAKVQHPDIISKLVWQEYVKPNLDNTFKRIEIKPEPGIYKLTSLQNGKCYIGKSVDVKKRIADHFKSSVGLSIISDQEVHHIIKKEGFWNWMIEIITYCEKDKLGELEKYYIDFFKSQTYGYNKRAGG